MEMFNPTAEAGVSRPEAQEIIELKKEFAAVLKKPHEGSYLKKLERVIGAFVLAGVVVFSPRSESIAPELSQEFVESVQHKFVNEIKKAGKIEIYEKILISLESAGGVPFSKEAPNKIFKTFPHHVKSQAMYEAFQHKKPYFSKPEIIFGEQFIKDHPKQAEEYMHKIEKAMQATVMVSHEAGSGSGVIINTKDGKVILTNAHVAEGAGARFIITALNGQNGIAHAIYVDNVRDLAVLKLTDAQSADIYNHTEVLNIDEAPTSSLKDKEKMAAIGHPLGFPYEVEITEFAGADKVSYASNEYQAIIHNADPRFKKLASYVSSFFKGLVQKGQILHGMSGGPVIALERDGEAKLVGLNSMIDNAKNLTGLFKKYAANADEGINEAVSADEIRAFIKDYESLRPPSVISSGEVY